MKTVILALLVLVLVVGSQESKFPYEDVLNDLNLTDNKLVRPAKDYKKPTWVYVQMSILAILDVKEIDQTFVSFVVIYMKWEDPHIYWKPHHFDGLDKMTVPTDLLWKPDLMIEEMIEKDKDIPNPFFTIHSNGFVENVKNLMVVSSCKMQVYKFPFDTQSCNLSLKSIIYPEEELKFQVYKNSSQATEWTREIMSTESEWLFMGMKVEHRSVPRFHQHQSVVIYTITMKRRPLLYIVNFLVPVLLLFGLDLASFVISDSGGEKLGFEVTLLLAVTVMQLILNDILPCSSDSIPLIAVYCIGIFSLMMVSLLETILVMYLIEKDSASKEKKADKKKQGNYDGDVKKWTRCACVCNVSDEPPSELLSVAKEDKRSQLMEESNSLEKHPDELSEAVKGLSLLLSRKEGRKPDYWTRVAKKLDRIFFFVYVTVSALFLVVLFSLWITAED
ncbi:5-hydroxytryptamine receptor 3A-like isoform X3 [Trematomus bernacchii]|uniref:5-hydroxytryptamine receptor 3A-like isoform X3 n=1 Tax=Trematomus bernacchii TaxID=40690 RepID=UPI00146BC207|nr:5-hydroxytryptamine receptor 3A-like isoform X3 [Trematomus bernacchii]XP_033970257.1 5-hydroxytryptamine receptor 3A-like isoform X3 [Trematomus bernacchii]